MPLLDNQAKSTKNHKHPRQRGGKPDWERSKIWDFLKDATEERFGLEE